MWGASQEAALRPLYQFLPWLPSVMDCNLEIWDDTKHFLSQGAFGHGTQLNSKELACQSKRCCALSLMFQDLVFVWGDVLARYLNFNLLLYNKFISMCWLYTGISLWHVDVYVTCFDHIHPSITVPYPLSPSLLPSTSLAVSPFTFESLSFLYPSSEWLPLRKQHVLVRIQGKQPSPTVGVNAN